MIETRENRLDLAIALLKDIGIGVNLDNEYRGEGADRGPVEVPVVASVWLGFSLEEWASLTRSGGDGYVGGCCGSMSHVQDILDGWWRFEDSVDVRVLREVAESVEAHNKGWTDGAVKRFETDIDELSPWDKIAVTWHLCRDFVDLAKGLCDAFKSRGETALNVVARSAELLNLNVLFGEGGKGGEADVCATELLTIARIRPALATLLQQLDEIAPDPIDGFAFESVRENTVEPEWEIVHNHRGLAVYETREEAEQILQSNIEASAQYEEAKERLLRRLRIRALRIEADGSIHWKETV